MSLLRNQINLRRRCFCRFVAFLILLPSAVQQPASCEESQPTSVLQPPDQIATPSVEANSLESAALLNGPLLSNQPSWTETLRAALLTAIPDKYEDLSHWGKTKSVFAGVRVQQRGFQVRVSERKKDVRHGFWHKYRIEFVEPDNHLKLVIDHIEQKELSRFQFQFNIASRLRCRGDFEQWMLGVKGLNFAVISEAEIQLVADCEISLRSESNRKSLLPDLILEPKVKLVRIFLHDLDIKRIGEIRGDLAEGIGDISRHDIENLLQKQESRVARKLNEAIDKNRNLLRIPSSKIW